MAFDLKDNVQQTLRSLPDAFRLFPLRDVEPPKDSSEWADFLWQHPQYAETGHYGITAIILADNPRALQEVVHDPELNRDYQRLGGTLIQILVSEEDLGKISDGTYWTS